MHTGIKLGVSALLATAFAVGSTVPAAADGYRGGYYGHGYGGYHGYYRGDSGLGDVLLGAAVIGGVAAIASAASQPHYGYDSYPAPVYPAPVYPAPAYQAPGYYSPGYPASGYAAPAQGYVSRPAGPVDQCARAAEQDADQDGGVARVVGIDRVRPSGESLRVFGTLQIDHGSTVYGVVPRPDHTRFDCTVSYGQITRLRLG